MASSLAGVAAPSGAVIRSAGPATTAIYRGMDQAALDRAYDNRATFPDWQDAVARYTAGSDAARALLRPVTARYGVRPREALDIYAPPGAQDAPVMIFVHGGAWRALSKDESAFAAPALVGAGIVYVAIDFTLVPEATLAELVNEARRAVKWVHAHVAEHGGDPARLHLCGHSSGAHVAAMLAGGNWRSCGLPEDTIKSAILVSGLYDLEPVQLSARNLDLKLDRVAALRLSPIRTLPPRHCAMLVAHAARETPELARQSIAYALASRAAGCRVETMAIAGRDHFTCIETLADPESALGTAARRMATG